MKQKLVSILLVLCMVVALVPAIALTSAAANGVALPDGATAYDGTPSESLSGEGTEDSPFIIANTADFMYFYNTLAATATAGQVFKMTDDVYWNAQDSTTYQTAGVDFAGVLDGGKHTIYNVYYKNEKGAASAVFGTVTGTIKNITFDGLKMETNANVSGICLTLSGSDALIENCHLVNTSISGRNISAVANAIAAGATVRGCSVKGTLTSTLYVGGIVCSIGSSQSGTIENCVNYASISGSITRAGGIICGSPDASDQATLLEIKGCENRGDITTTKANAQVGGIIGFAYRIITLNVVNCANYRAITSTAIAGGIIGYGETHRTSLITLDGCQNAASITSTGSNVGGLVGKLSPLKKVVTIKNCAVTGTISGVDNIGGIIGSHTTDQYTTNDLIIANSYVNADVIASGSYASLAIGQHTMNSTAPIAAVQNCVVMGTVTANTNAGALVGLLATNNAKGTSFAPKVSLANSFVKATVSVKADGQVATLIGAAGTKVSGVTLTTTDAAILVTVKVGETEVASPVTYYIGAGDGMTADIAVLDVNALTNKTAVAKLNAYATENSFAEWVQGTNAPELTLFYVAPEVPEITIDGASLTIGGNVTMNLFVKKTTVAAAGVTLGKISIVDNDNTPYEVTDDSGDYYVFTIKGLHASEFGKNKIYHVQYTTADAPGTPIDCTATKEYSPLQYAINMYNADDKTETVTDLDKLLLSIVNYADAAAKTTDASTAFKAVHTKADFSTLPTFEAIIAEDTGVYTYDKLKTEKNLPGISANLTETIALTFTFNSGTYTYMKDNSDMMMIGNAEIPGKVNTLSVVFSELFATDLYNTITLTFKETLDSDSGLTVTATTSLVQFLKSYQGTAEEALAAATAQYLYVARLFCLNNQPNA